MSVLDNSFTHSSGAFFVAGLYSRRTWVGLSENLIFRVFQNNVLFANVIVVVLGCSPKVQP